MSWDVKLARLDGKSLGTVENVSEAIRMLLPTVRFYREPGGQRKVDSLQARGVDLPDALQRFFQGRPDTTQADYTADGYLLRFFLGAGGELAYLHVAVNGDLAGGERELTRLATSQDWVLAPYSSRDAEHE